eukprot:COSAG01_NODE_1179_length_11363_cov_18.944701_2_plen_55_part_00
MMGATHARTHARSMHKRLHMGGHLAGLVLASMSGNAPTRALSLSEDADENPTGA